MPKTKSGTFNQQKYVNEYCKENYDRCIFNIPKGRKASLEAHWRAKGYKSLNQYINALLRANGVQLDDNDQETPDSKAPSSGIKIASR